MADDGAGDIVDHGRREVHAIARGGLVGAALHDGTAQFEVKARDRHDQPAREARADALIEHFEIARRRIAGHHDLLGPGEQRAQRMAEFGGRLALQELHVIDQQQVDAAQPFLEAERGLALHGGDEMVHEVVGGQIDDVLGGIGRLHGMGDGVEQVGFAQADGGMDIDRVEGHGIVGGGIGDLLGNAKGHFIGFAGHEAVKGHARIDGAARQRIALGLCCRVARKARHGRSQHGRAGGCGGRGLLGGRRLGDDRGQARTGLAIDAQRHLDAADGFGVLAEGLQDAVGIVGLNPGAQKARGRGQVHHVVDDLFQLEAGEPGGEHIGTDRRLDPGTHAVPEFALAFGGVGCGHDRSIAFGGQGDGCRVGGVPIRLSGGRLSRHCQPRFFSPAGPQSPASSILVSPWP